MDQFKSFSKTVARKHRLALGVFLILVLINFFAIQAIIQFKEDDGHIINVSGQQRMLSQKIALYATRLDFDIATDDRATIINLLENAITQFEQNHNKLIELAPIIGAAPAQDTLQALYFSGTPSLHEQITTFISWARYKLEFGKTVNDKLYSAAELESMLNGLDYVVDKYQATAVQKHQRLEWFVYIISFAMLLTLWLNLHFVFQPLQTQIKKTVELLEQEKTAAEELKKNATLANNAKSKFIADLSHELRIPLNGLFGMLDLAIEQKGTMIKDDLIRKAKRSGKQILRVVNEMLDIAAIEANNQKIETENFSVKQMLDECLSPISIICEQKHLKLNINISESMPEYLFGAGQKLTQIVNNLLNNAVKYTDSGFITFTARSQFTNDAMLLIIEVSDSGIGMTKDQQKAIFQNASEGQLDGSRTYTATGIGLGIVNELLKRLGGNMQIHSEYGRGSRFTISLPFQVATMPSERQQEIAQYAAQYDLSHKKVAVVDDLAISREFILHQLTVLNVQGDFFSSGEDLLNSDINQYDVFVIDLVMPEMDGDQLADKLKPKLSPLKNQKLILISASEEKIEDYQSHNEKFDYLLTKPLEESRFYDALIASLLPNAANHNPSKYNILIAEDNDINAQIAKQFLTSMGYNVYRVSNGQEVVDICNESKSRFDLILMDINMPQMDGYQATNLLRTKLGLTIPIIATSANAFEADIERSLSSGMNKHLVKPLSKDKLEQVIKSYLGEVANFQ